MRTLDHAIETLGRRKVHRLDPPGAGSCGWAPTSSATWTASRAAPRSTNRSGARARSFGLARRSRSRTPSCAGSPKESTSYSRSPGDRHRPGGPQALLPRLDCREHGGAISASQQPLELMRAQNEPAEVAVRLVRGEIEGTPRSRDSGRVARRPGRRARAFGGPHLATEPGLPARRADGRCAGGRADTRCLRRSRWQGDDVPGGEVVAVDVNEARARELKETVERLGASNVRVVVVDQPLAPAGARRLRSRPRRCALLGSRGRRQQAICAGGPSRFELRLELLRAASERIRPGGTIVYSVYTIKYGTARRMQVVDASGLEVDASLVEEWLLVRPGKPSSCRRCLTSMEPRASSSPGCGCRPAALDRAGRPSSSWSTRSSWPSGGGGRYTRIRSSARSWSRAARSSARVGTREKGGDARPGGRRASGNAGTGPRCDSRRVTLEPCAHGETPPCVDALVEAGVARVVAGDRSAPEHGGGLEGRAGVEVELADDELGFRCRQQIEGVADVGLRRREPFVTYKVAVSLVGGSPCPTRDGSAVRTRGDWYT